MHLIAGVVREPKMSSITPELIMNFCSTRELMQNFGLPANPPLSEQGTDPFPSWPGPTLACY